VSAEVEDETPSPDPLRVELHTYIIGRALASQPPIGLRAYEVQGARAIRRGAVTIGTVKSSRLHRPLRARAIIDFRARMDLVPVEPGPWYAVLSDTGEIDLIRHPAGPDHQPVRWACPACDGQGCLTCEWAGWRTDSYFGVTAPPTPSALDEVWIVRPEDRLVVRSSCDTDYLGELQALLTRVYGDRFVVFGPGVEVRVATPEREDAPPEQGATP
jgi:hypothetical protein